MSRIRSVHPGLWTDERFMEVSPLARLLFIGIWNECDDAGSFEWSPIKLKARLLPVDNCDVVALLAELEAVGSVMRYEVAGRRLGAVRNFTRFQRPKKPNSQYPQTDEVRNFCAGEAGEVRNQFPTGGEIRPQMEEGGGSSEASASGAASADDPLPSPQIAEEPPPPPDPDKVMFDSGLRLLTEGGITEAKARPMLGRWRRDHGTEAVIVALGKAQREGAIDPVSFIEGCLRNGSNRRTGAADRLRGPRPDPALDLWLQSRAELDAEGVAEGEEPDFGTWPALPAQG